MAYINRTGALFGVMAAATVLGGCTRIVGQQGHILDDTLVAAIQPGVDNRDSVAGTIGRPSFTGQFNGAERDWYYFSRRTRQLAFQTPRATQQTVLHVRFDENGTVERVDRTGLELANNIRPSNEETPTLGRHQSLFEELFGNIGALGSSGQRGQTTDNPQ
ncbi:outer membrane protein assembly factor BamE [Sphingosinicella sp.]|uniref:outer membrane protein assembly factor BamE n=1 Tax=Sphingosinicella sp. TaxID=1917971 RepID=UPI0040376467